MANRNDLYIKSIIPIAEKVMNRCEDLNMPTIMISQLGTAEGKSPFGVCYSCPADGKGEHPMIKFISLLVKDRETMAEDDEFKLMLMSIAYEELDKNQLLEVLARKREAKGDGNAWVN